MTPARKAVLSYLREWLDWVEAGAVEGEPFSRRAGLCPQAPVVVRDELFSLRNADFGNDADDWVYPFGSSDYLHRAATRTQHECPARLAWVRAKLAEVDNCG